MSHKFQIKDGKLKIYNQERFNIDVSRFKENQIGILELHKYEEQETSLAQYGFLFGFLIPEISDSYGESKTYIKETLKLAYNPITVKCFDLTTDRGVIQKTGGSLSRAKCTKKKLAEVIQGGIDWALELDIVIPDMDDWAKENPGIVNKYKNV